MSEEGKGNETKKYYEELQRNLFKVNQNDYVILTRDINYRIRKDPVFLIGIHSKQIITIARDERICGF